jgi:hypothetical protein
MSNLMALYEDLKSKKIQPYYFGLGFIQLKINNYQRYHFYHPDLAPIINVEEEIHNHRYDFQSEILAGEINNKIYHFHSNLNGNYIKSNESCSESKILTKEEKDYQLGDKKLFSSLLYIAGNTYFMDYRTFHTIEAKKCITKLTRSDYMQDYAQVIREKETSPICPFSKKISEESCWKIIKDLIINAK